MDFSAFVKSVFQVLSRHKNWEHVGCHVALGHDLHQREGHAVNYISVKAPDGSAKIYELDITWDFARYQKGKPLQGITYSVMADTSEDIPKTIREALGDDVTEEAFLESVDSLSRDAFDDQCTGANPRYPLVQEIKEMYLRAYYGK